MKNKIFLIILLGLFLFPLVSALESLGTYKVGDAIRICQICNDATFITISSITYPNSSIAINQTNMTYYGSGEFCYNFTNTTTGGRYQFRGISDGCSESGNNFVTYFDLNPAGIESTDSRTSTITRSIYFLFAIALILFIAFLFIKAKPSVKWTFFLISIMFFLQAVSILFTGMQDEVVNPKIENYFSFLASSSFILFWFAFGILAVLWILTTFQTIMFNKVQKKKEKYG